MATATKSGQSLSFTYGYDGLRTTKTVNGVVHTYYYSGGKLMRLTYGDYVLDFFYDQNGTPFMLLQNGNIYYYITNAQGDVIRLVDINGNTAASYRYDPYGKAISALGSHATINPLRYRGYVFDHETGLYYLQSRYYDPEIGRFINADAYASTGQGLLSNNMFVYCLNNFINLEDTSGHLPRKNTVFVCDGAGGDIGPLGIISSDYYHELHDKNMQANEVHATGQWFDTDWPSFIHLPKMIPVRCIKSSIIIDSTRKRKYISVTSVRLLIDYPVHTSPLFRRTNS